MGGGVQSGYGPLGWKQGGPTLLLRTMPGLSLTSFSVLTVRCSRVKMGKGLVDLTSLKSSSSLSPEFSPRSTISSEQSISLQPHVAGAVRSGTSSNTSSSDMSFSFSAALGPFSRDLSCGLLLFWASFCTWASRRCFFLGGMRSVSKENYW